MKIVCPKQYQSCLPFILSLCQSTSACLPISGSSPNVSSNTKLDSAVGAAVRDPPCPRTQGRTICSILKGV